MPSLPLIVAAVWSGGNGPSIRLRRSVMLLTAAAEVVLAPALFLPRGEVAGMVDAGPVKFSGCLGRATRCCHYCRHKMLENAFTLGSVLDQAPFSVLSAQPVLLLPCAADLPSSPLEELREGGEFSPGARHSAQ